jgi:glutathione S-transferase
VRDSNSRRVYVLPRVGAVVTKRFTSVAAILTWRGATYGKEGFGHDARLSRKDAEALSYMSSEVHATDGGHFNNQKFAETQAAQNRVKKKTY